MANAGSPNTPAVQISAPPSLISCIDIVDRATAPFPNDKQSGAIISIDFKFPSNLFFDQVEETPTFNLDLVIHIKGKKEAPIEIKEVAASQFDLNNNIAELLIESSAGPTFKAIENTEKGKVVAKFCPPADGYDIDNDNNVRVVVLLDIYPSKIDVAVSLSAINGTKKLRDAVTGTARSYVGSSPDQTKLRDLLCWTAAFGHFKAFQAYLNQLPLGIESEDAFGMTPFSWAALGGQASVVRLALQQAGSVGARRRTANGPAPLEAAAHSQDERFFESLLEWLKYLESPVAIHVGPEPIPEHGSKLDDGDIEREIHSAIRNKQTFMTQRLVEMLYKSQGKHDKKNWLANEIIEAAEKGDLYLVQALRSCGAEINCKNVDSVTPLMGAINNKKAKVAEYLISQGAEDDNDSSALKQAVKTSQHSTIRALLQVKIQMDSNLKQVLLEMAGEQDSTTLMLLQLEKGVEELATPKSLYPEVDKLFHATVVDFTEEKTPEFTELTVNDLMQPQKHLMERQKKLFDLEKSNFKWFHLPANNMKWAEALISKIYHNDPSLAYKVLEPKRWIKRQHEGENGSSHARFMMSACHDFQEAFADKNKSAYEKEDRHVVLFMPYLHWDDEAAMRKRSEILAKPLSKAAMPPATTHKPSSSTAVPPTASINVSLSGSATTIRSNTPLRETSPNTETPQEFPKAMFRREEMLIEKYLRSELRDNENSRHLLHVRRTLDQSLYHNLKDTKIRDADQTVRRYQELLNEGKKPDEIPLTVIMVDQLWLWILLSPSGKAQAVVTCFPSRDRFDVKTPNGQKLDPKRTTDVFQTTKSYIQQRPDAVKTPYDLAGVIASRCSRALLDHSTDMLDFTEVYENSISYIMNEEVLLFNNFNYLMQTRTKAMEDLQTRARAAEKVQIQLKAKKELQSLAKTMEEHPSLARAMKELPSFEKAMEELQTRAKATEKQQNTKPPNEKADHKKFDSRLAMDIVDETKALDSNDKSIKEIKKRCREYREYARVTEIPDEKEMKGLSEKTEHDKERLTKLLEKFGRFFVLDITREIFLLRQIKDIQDELEMMGKVFADQKDVIEGMDRIIRAMIRPNLGPNDHKNIKASVIESDPRESFHSLRPEREHIDRVQNFSIKRKRSSTLGSFLFDDSSSSSGDEDSSAYKPLGYLQQETQKRKRFMKQAQSMIWQFRHQKQNLPLRTVDRFAKLIKKMNERAKNTNKALTNLVDLKQKQSNMIDTRTTRLQAEESHKMAQESESQGRTLMVFTIVTIVFLPLSFIAAFFAIPVKEFNSGNTLTLDFVSKITFPVSAATSLLFIGIGFAASKWEWFVTLIKQHKTVPRQKSVDLEANRAPLP